MIVDIHNHILPGLDDGPKNWTETVLLAEQAVAAGITHVIATPHHKHRHGNHYYVNDPNNIILLVKKTEKLFEKLGVPLSVHPGIEFHLHDGIREDLEERLDHFLTLNNTMKYMLIEPPCGYYPQYTKEVCIDLRRKGFVPILAHPERNRVLRDNPEKIYDLVREGVLVQITAASITGKGRRLKNFSLHLLDHDLVHFIASDAHHFTRRKFELNSAYEYIKENYSVNYQKYLERNAAHVLQGTEFEIKQPRFIEKKIQYFFLYNHPLNERRIGRARLH